jgi:hypothetical protein
MSTDYDVVCDECKQSRHLGQFMGGLYSFGYGSKDTETTPTIMRWISEHLDHVKALRVMNTDCVPEDYSWEESAEEQVRIVGVDT